MDNGMIDDEMIDDEMIDTGVIEMGTTGVAGAGEVTITVCPNGPLLVRGPARLTDIDGETVDHDRRVIALCRCGRSALKPLCDGSHRQSRFHHDADAQQMSTTVQTARAQDQNGADPRS